ncbi:fimbrial protein [Morganella psychrotolerans]|uniref:fimbrial protein n=1 Tax=Morganella psychrotolerans TaxID=368603 RepID=UPI0039B01B18
MIKKSFIAGMLLHLPLSATADIHITLEATLIRQPCTLTAEDGKNTLAINFQDVEINKFSQAKKDFNILIKKCDLKKNFKIYLLPKDGGTLNINNETVLATSTEGLGIRFSQKNKTSAVNLQQWEAISPAIIGSSAKFTLQSQLVTQKPVEELEDGPFKAALSVMVDYI